MTECRGGRIADVDVGDDPVVAALFELELGGVGAVEALAVLEGDFAAERALRGGAIAVSLIEQLDSDTVWLFCSRKPLSRLWICSGFIVRQTLATCAALSDACAAA